MKKKYIKLIVFVSYSINLALLASVKECRAGCQYFSCRIMTHDKETMKKLPQHIRNMRMCRIKKKKAYNKIPLSELYDRTYCGMTKVLNYEQEDAVRERSPARYGCMRKDLTGCSRL